MVRKSIHLTEGVPGIVWPRSRDLFAATQGLFEPLLKRSSIRDDSPVVIGNGDKIQTVLVHLNEFRNVQFHRCAPLDVKIALHQRTPAQLSLAADECMFASTTCVARALVVERSDLRDPPDEFGDLLSAV